MYVWLCSSRCAAGDSWKLLKLADVYSYAEAVAFGPGGSLQVIEPPSSLGLLDTIVGDVVSSYLGK